MDLGYSLKESVVNSVKNSVSIPVWDLVEDLTTPSQWFITRKILCVDIRRFTRIEIDEFR